MKNGKFKTNNNWSTTMDNQNYWKKCSVCKAELKFEDVYYQCSVSNCKKFSFCSVKCWDVHSGVMNHKSAGADECVAPKALFEEEIAKRKILANTPKMGTTIASSMSNTSIPKDILVVASKFKEYVKIKHDLSTSANVMSMLSDIIRVLADKASENAKQDGRKTLMDRDFENVIF